MSRIPESIYFPDRIGSFQKKRLFSGESPSHRDVSMDRVPQTPEAVRFKPSRPKNPEIIIKSQYVHSRGGWVGEEGHTQKWEKQSICNTVLQAHNLLKMQSSKVLLTTSSPISAPPQPHRSLKQLSP